MDALWEIMLLCTDEKVMEDSLTLICTLHLNLDDNHYEQEEKFKIWESFVSRCLENLKPGHDITTINSAIMCLIRFFDIYDGRTLTNAEIHQSSAYPVHVYCTDDNSKKIVSIPYGGNISYLRKMIAWAYDISVNEYLLYANHKLIGPDEDETLMREVGFSTIFVIRKIQDEKANLHPKNLLVGNQEFFNLMFELLSNDKDYDVESIWKLLMMLPQDEVPTAKKIEKLEVESDADWAELIDGSSLHKLLYSLQIVNKYLVNESEWQNQFLVMRGYHHLFKTLLQIDPSKVNSSLAFKSVDILCKVICDSMQESSELMSHFKEHSLEAIDKIIKLIHQVTRISLVDLKKRGESYDDLYYKNKQSEQKNFRMMSYYSEKNKSENEQEEQSQYTRQINALNTKFDQVGKFVTLSFRLLFHFDAYTNEDCIGKLNEYPELVQLLQGTLLETDNFYIRDQFADGLTDIL